MNATKLGHCENKGWPCPDAYRTCRDAHVLCCLLTSSAIVSLVSTRVKCCSQHDTKPFVSLISHSPGQTIFKIRKRDRIGGAPPF
ncbi:hypothetical protein Q9966_005345 [Columba livia]|nr:hypothetical protein Q9966_005345 [Columba livia]